MRGDFHHPTPNLTKTYRIKPSAFSVVPIGTLDLFTTMWKSKNLEKMNSYRGPWAYARLMACGPSDFERIFQAQPKDSYRAQMAWISTTH